MHGSYNVLAANGTFAHALATLGAGDHVTTLQQHTVDDRIHADAAEVVVLIGQLGLLPFCQRAREWRLQEIHNRTGAGWGPNPAQGTPSLEGERKRLEERDI